MYCPSAEKNKNTNISRLRSTVVLADGGQNPVSYSAARLVDATLRCMNNGRKERFARAITAE